MEGGGCDAPEGVKRINGFVTRHIDILRVNALHDLILDAALPGFVKLKWYTSQVVS